ncbi:MAG TPA: phasin family protein [Allosphingosinicella sp.]|jgi:phasin family protein
MADRKVKAGVSKAATAKPAAPEPKKLAETKPPVAAKAPEPVKPPLAAPVVEARPALEPAAEVSRTALEAAQQAVELTNQTVNRVNEGTRTMTNETIEKVQATQAAAANRIQAAFGDVNERAKTAMEKSTKVLEEMTDLTKGNVEAIVASSKVVARGVETLGQEAADYGRRSFEEASAALKSLAEVKSATDFFRLQSDFARSAFDSLVAETSKVSEQVIKLAGEVAEPITSRYSVAAERVKNVAAL